MKMKNQSCVNSKWMKFGAFLSELCGIFLIVYSFVTVIVDRGMNFSTLETLLAKAFPVWCAAVAGAFFIFIFPNLKNAKVRKAVSVVSVCALVFVTYASLFPVSPYSFTSGPVVFDDGKGAYSVVFSTNDKGTGYVDYIYNGKEIRAFDEKTEEKTGKALFTLLKFRRSIFQEIHIKLVQRA